jgi:L-2-hydroxyglutarate oxidase LhgO
VDSTDVIVIGAGVIGLAVARELARAGREVIVLERNPRIGEEMSARSSEVIHAGIYYAEGSLKARCCVRGRSLLYRYCEEHGVPSRPCGKLIVATDPGQLDELDALHAQARANGVNDAERLSAAEAARLEPAVRCAGAVWSPATGIVDSHALMLALRGDIEAAGGTIACLSEFRDGNVRPDGLLLNVRSGDADAAILATSLVNCAGLRASATAGAIEGLSPEHVPHTRYAKGNYFVLQGKTPFRHLIYPLPEPGGLGVHVTLDMNGQARFGPDVEWIEKLDYSVDPARAQAFYRSIRSYWPEAPADGLLPGYAGVRPKLVAPGEPAADFLISGPAEHGVAGLVNLFGIESPGLTSALAIAERVADALR